MIPYSVCYRPLNVPRIEVLKSRCAQGHFPRKIQRTTDSRPSLFDVKRSHECSQKSRCTRGKFQARVIHTCEAACPRPGQDTRARDLATGSRRKVEALFAELVIVFDIQTLLRCVNFTFVGVRQSPSPHG